MNKPRECWRLEHPNGELSVAAHDTIAYARECFGEGKLVRFREVITREVWIPEKGNGTLRLNHADTKPIYEALLEDDHYVKFREVIE